MRSKELYLIMTPTVMWYAWSYDESYKASFDNKQTLGIRIDSFFAGGWGALFIRCEKWFFFLRKKSIINNCRPSSLVLYIIRFSTLTLLCNTYNITSKRLLIGFQLFKKNAIPIQIFWNISEWWIIHFLLKLTGFGNWDQP